MSALATSCSPAGSARAWHDQGLPVVVDGDLRREGVVSAFHTREGLQSAVVLVRRHDRTLGFTALKDLRARVPSPGPEESLLPEGTLLAQELSASRQPGGTRLHSALLEQELEATSTALEQRLASRGFHRAREPVQHDGGQARLLLEHSRGQERLLTALTQLEPGLVAVFQAHTRQGATP